MRFFLLVFLTENGVLPQGVFDQIREFGSHLAAPIEPTEAPGFQRDGVIENQIDINFEEGSYSPYRFIPTVHRGQNQARKR